MNSTIDEPNNLDEPHFDEEATILAARPVVPLDEVPEPKRPQRPRGRIALTLAIAGGLLIGLLAAALIFRYLNIGEPATTTTVAEQPASEQPAMQPSSPAGGAVATVDEAANDIIAEEKPVVAEEKPEPEPEESRKIRTPDRTAEVEPRRPVVVRDTPRRSNDEEDDEVERATRRSQRQEERRERRRAVREARRQERRQSSTSDDLTRIREIFEGTPRP